MIMGLLHPLFYFSGILLVTIASGLRCPGKEWHYRKGTNQCYYIFRNTNQVSDSTPVAETRSFNNAILECRIRGGKLATIDNAEEFEYLANKLALTTYYWVGMTYENLKWQWYDGGEYTDYTDISGLTIPSFNESESNEDRSSRRLSLYNAYDSNIFKFFLEWNTSRNGYICKGDWSNRPWCNIDEGWSYRDGACVQYYPLPFRFDLANMRCSAEGGHLHVINSQYEDDHYKSWLRNTVNSERGWLGISIENKTAQTSISNVAWKDGTPITDTSISNWAVKNLTNYISQLPNGQRYCGEMYTTEAYYLYDDYADEPFDENHDWLLKNQCNEAKPFACERPIGKCPTGWKEFNDNCYQFNLGEDRLRTWDQAKKDCKDQAGDLMTIENHETQLYMMDVLYTEFDALSTDRPYYWIGLKGSDQSFTWVNAQRPITADAYQSWSDGTLPQITGESCVYVDGTASWYEENHGDWIPTLCTQKMGYICEAHYTAPIPPVETVYPATVCEKPFEKFHEGCYLVVKEKKNRHDAQVYCQEKKSNLVVINSFGENIWLQQKVTNDSWIGLMIVGNEGTKWKYEYSDGRMVGRGAFLRWDDVIESFETDPNFSKFCAAMAGDDSTYSISSFPKYAKKGYWYHLPCTEQREFVCYQDGTPVSRPNNTHDDPVCGAGWFRDGNNCYQVHDNPVPWRLAKQTCQNLANDSDLLYVTSKAEHQFLYNLVVQNLSAMEDDIWGDGFSISTNYWLDFYAEAAGTWHWPYRDVPDKWHIPLTLTNWALDQPTTDFLTVARPRCAAIVANSLFVPRWYSFACESTHPYICKKVIPTLTPIVTPRPTPRPNQIMGCPTRWLPFHGRCIKIEPATIEWPAARAACRKLSGELITLRTQAEFEEMKNFGAGSWIGLNSIIDPDLPREFVWSGGQPLTFTPWDAESANAMVGESTDVNCGALTYNGFSMYSCSQKKSFLCEMSLQSVNPTAQPDRPPQAEGCEIGAYPLHESCYHFGEDPNSLTRKFFTFRQAQDFCKDIYGGRLATVGDAEEQRYLSSHVARFEGEFWIGLKQDPNPWNAFLQWTNNDLVTTTHWAPDQPRSIAGEGCVAIYGAYNDDWLPGDWYVDFCSERKFALCEAPRDFHPSHRPTYPTTPRPTGCPQSWKTKPELENCYKEYVGQKFGPVVGVPWQDAEDFCRNFHQGHLVSITSRVEQEFVDFNVQSAFISGRHYWIGLNQNPAQQNRWLWSNGDALVITNFDIENDHSTIEVQNCVSMESMSGKWVQQNCMQAYGWVCEIPKGAYVEGDIVEEFPTALPINTTCGRSTSEGQWFFDNNVQECLYFSIKTNTWQDAQDDCRGLEGNLVTVMNQAHHNWLSMKSSQLSGDDSAHYWIGLYQTDYAGKQFEWIDGHTSTFRAWEFGQPDPRGTERCVGQNTKSGLWRDLNCGRPHNYICAKSTRHHPQKPTEMPELGYCPTGWVHFYNNCYFFAGKEHENTTWEEAHTFCNSQSLPRPELVSIHSAVENDLLILEMKERGLLGKNFWTGLHRIDDGNDYAWSDNSPLRYLNWHFDEPPAFDETKNCVEFVSSKVGVGRWQTVPCSKKQFFVCKAGKDQNASPPEIQSICPTGYTEFGGNCFVIQQLDQGKDSWNEAQTKCRSIGDQHGDLATISDIYENALIHVLLSEHWRGHNGNHSNRAWIGMKEHFSHFAWYNTCPVVFSNFYSFVGKPVTTTCVAIGQDGKWRTDDCEFASQFAVCEHRNTPCPAVYNLTEYDYCPENFPHECTRSCYRVQTSFSHQDISEKKSFPEAKIECEKYNGKLAVIRTEEDQKCLNNYVTGSLHGMWIGLYEEIIEGRPVWKWVDSEWDYGLSSSYLNWAPYYPTNNSDIYFRKACGEMLQNGSWINTECDLWERKGFICESPKQKRSTPRVTTTLPPPIVPCGDSSNKGDWYYIPNTDECLFISKISETSWDNSTVHCLQLGATLAIVTLENNAFITQTVSAYTAVKQYWIGLRVSNFVLGEHEWVNNSSLTFENWENGAGEDYCVTVVSNTGKWRDQRYSERHEYLCTRPSAVIPSEKPTNISSGVSTSSSVGGTESTTETFVQHETQLPTKADVEDTKKENNGLSSGSIAGIVISVLLITGIAGAVVFIILTGKKDVLLRRFQNTTTSVREAGVRFVPARYRSTNREVIIDDKSSKGEAYS